MKIINVKEVEIRMHQTLSLAESVRSEKGNNNRHRVLQKVVSRVVDYCKSIADCDGNLDAAKGAQIFAEHDVHNKCARGEKLVWGKTIDFHDYFYKGESGRNALYFAWYIAKVNYFGGFLEDTLADFIKDSVHRIGANAN